MTMIYLPHLVPIKLVAGQGVKPTAWPFGGSETSSATRVQSEEVTLSDGQGALADRKLGRFRGPDLSTLCWRG